ncbi:hypothetical protein BaRGS_00012345 [Batillaria attramentaria]|uniref:AN1-type domain-containing protein n=1 Tax=Batillaria attramentaria TaxID=370345 RepID=A0ABD0LAZ9_9CAEN
MEFPHLGQHCSNAACKQLDFLPMNCDACGQTFCKDHIHYETHSCAKSYEKDNQVPVCPLCNSPCPVKKGESPDVVVGQHIDNDCLSDPAKERRKIYTNKCSYKSCKQKELIPVKCETCTGTTVFDIAMSRTTSVRVSRSRARSVNAGAAAMFRSQQPGTSKPSSSSSSSGSSLSQKSPQQTALAGLGRQLDQLQLDNMRMSEYLFKEFIFLSCRRACFTPYVRHYMYINSLLVYIVQTEDEALRYAMQMSMANSFWARCTKFTATRPRRQEKSTCHLS